MRPSEVLRRGADYLEHHGVESARVQAEVLMMSVLGCDRAGIYSRSEPLMPEQARAYGRALCQRCEGTPLQHLTGSQVFRGLELVTRPGVFIPRQETEVVVERALEHLEEGAAPKVLDVGTGTGAIALSIASARPEAEVHAVDVSEAALTLASENATRLGLEVDLHEGDMFDGVPERLRGALDLIVSNPPYVARDGYHDLPAEVRADPIEALVGDPAIYRRLASGAAEWLASSGWLVAEIGAEQGREVAALFSEALCDVAVLSDLAGRHRIVEGRR